MLTATDNPSRAAKPATSRDFLDGAEPWHARAEQAAEGFPGAG